MGWEDDEECYHQWQLVMEQRVGILFLAMDTNRDGLVSWEEFLAFFSQNKI